MAREMDEILKQQNAQRANSCISETGASFMDQVIAPLYKVVAAEAMNNDNEKAAHSFWRNYDDFNEYFWSLRCFELSWPWRRNAPFFQKPKPRTKILLKTSGNQRQGKTSFVEHQTFLHLYHSFHRLWIFLVMMFQGLCILAFNNERFDSNTLRELLSLGPTFVIMKLMERVVQSPLRYWIPNATKLNSKGHLRGLLFEDSPFSSLRTVEDFRDWTNCLFYRGGIGVKGAESWEAWWEEKLSHIRTFGGGVMETLLSLRFFIFQYGIVYKLKIQGNDTSLTVYGLSWVVSAVLILLFKVFTFSQKVSVNFQLLLRFIQGITFLMALAGLALAVVFTNLSVPDLFACILAFIPTGWGIPPPICIIDVLLFRSLCKYQEERKVRGGAKGHVL